MKKQFFFSVLAIAFLSFAFIKPAGKFYNVDTANSSIQWKGYKVTGEHYGVVNLKSGALTVDDKGNFNGGSFVVDMASITVLDLTGKGKENLEGHLKSADFFGVENFPTAKFVINKVIPKGKPGEYKVIGSMTMLTITQKPPQRIARSRPNRSPSAPAGRLASMYENAPDALNTPRNSGPCPRRNT